MSSNGDDGFHEGIVPRRHGGHREERIQNSSANAVFHELDIEVHQQPNTNATQFQVCEKLRFVHWCDALDAFDFEKDFLVDDNV